MDVTEPLVTQLHELPFSQWQIDAKASDQQTAISELEKGNVIYCPQLAFALTDAEREFLSEDTVAGSKNVNYDINTDRLRGTKELSEQQTAAMRAMMVRYANVTQDFIKQLMPHYQDALIRHRTSFRPAKVEGRETSWRKDDTRLHVDSFPATPVQGMRILRMFTNVNPDGVPRCWRVGENFEHVAQRFLPSISAPIPLSRDLMNLVGITKSKRSLYDHYMLNLHDAMKADMAYQQSAAQMDVDFPPGASWMVFTDQVSHAAMSGQFLFEQTFYLPIDSLQYPELSPLKVLEKMKNKVLV